MKKVPRVSIGMPLYNAEEYLELAIKDLLNQDFEDFELIVSDNKSLDNTKEIVLNYQKLDKRIKFYENDENIGSIKNFDKAFYLSSGKYFMWAAHDDRHDKTFISKCIKKLEEKPNAVLANTQWYWINEAGSVIKEMQEQYPALGLTTSGMSLIERFESLFKYKSWPIFYSLIRSEALKKCLPNQNEYGGDILLLTKLILLGDFVSVTERLFSYMYIPKDVNEYLNQFSLISNSNLKPFSGMIKNIYNIIMETTLEKSLKKELVLSLSKMLKGNLFDWFYLIKEEYKDKDEYNKIFLNGLNNSIDKNKTYTYSLKKINASFNNNESEVQKKIKEAFNYSFLVKNKNWIENIYLENKEILDDIFLEGLFNTIDSKNTLIEKKEESIELIENNKALLESILLKMDNQNQTNSTYLTIIIYDIKKIEDFEKKLVDIKKQTIYEKIELITLIENETIYERLIKEFNQENIHFFFIKELNLEKAIDFSSSKYIMLFNFESFYKENTLEVCLSYLEENDLELLEGDYLIDNKIITSENMFSPFFIFRKTLEKDILLNLKNKKSFYLKNTVCCITSKEKQSNFLKKTNILFNNKKDFNYNNTSKTYFDINIENTINFKHKESKYFILANNLNLGSFPLFYLNEYVDKIWVSTEYHKRKASFYGVKIDNIEVIPYLIDSDSYQEAKKLKNDSYTFLFEGDFSNIDTVQTIIKAYSEEFKSNEKVLLIIKNSNYFTNKLFRVFELINSLKINTNIDVITSYFTEEENLELYKKIDCFVYPCSESESLIYPFKALLGNKQIIISDLGCEEFKNSILLKNDFNKNSDEYSLGCFKVNYEELRKQLRNTFETRENIIHEYKGYSKKEVYEKIKLSIQAIKGKEVKSKYIKNNSYKTLFLSAYKAYINSHYKSALKLFSKVLEKEKNLDYDIYFYMYNCLKNMEDLRTAQFFYKRFIALFNSQNGK